MKAARRELFSEINITPLTDIFLVLLIIMMVVAPMLDYRGLDMKVATGAPTDVKPDDNNRVWVAVDADGQYKIDGNPVAVPDLATALRKQVAEKTGGVVIEVDPEANHAALAHAIDSAQLAGIEQVSVVEASPSAPEPPLKTKKK
jgi:biopolymer transport protein ExbD/biopolymer transport protein TolR